jgi:hypothetical protein
VTDTSNAIATPSHDENEALRSALATRVLTFMTAPSAREFDALALAVHDYQYRMNAPYRRYADRSGCGTPRHWTEIPAVPVAAFRDSVLACAPAERVYESSGTTRGPERRARHHVPHLAIYRSAALAGFARAVLPTGERRPFLVAAPERASHPASSLGEMVTWLRERHDAGNTPSFLVGRELDAPGMAAALDRADGRPLLLLGVTSALLRFADHAEAVGRRWQLAPGTLIVDTGGCKGYASELARSEILARYARTIGVMPEQVVNEYGMTELSSQLYARGLAPFSPPPWLRVTVRHPATGAEQPAGEPGLLRYFDLANLESVSAIQTDDVGRMVDGGIELIGRAPDAETRGCSLLLAE